MLRTGEKEVRRQESGEVGPEVGEAFALGEVVGEFFEVAEPHALVLPVDEACGV